MKKLLLPAIIATSVFLAPNAQADLKSKFSLKKKNIQIVSASKKEESAFEASSAVYVLTQEDIKRIGAKTIPEALRAVPGVQVAKMNSNTWAVTIRGFNSQFANKLLVLIDGQSVYTPTFSGTWWDSNNTPLLEDIEKIEVIRGPGATVWGANAVNGVVNIITKSSKLTQGTHVLVGGGNEERAFAEVRKGGKLSDKTSYRIFAKKEKRAGDIEVAGNETDDWETSNVGFRIDSDISKTKKLYVKADYFDHDINSDYTNPTTFAFENSETKSTGARILAKYQAAIDKDSDFFVQGYIDYFARDLPFLDIERTTADIEAQYNYSGLEGHEINAGVEVRYHDGKLLDKPVGGTSFITYNPKEDTYSSYSAFIQDKFELIDDKLFLTIGSKFEYNYFTDWEIQPNLRLTYLADKNTTIWGAVSRASRTPTRAERGINLLANPVISQVGNINFDSEVLTAYEAGIRFRPRNNIMADLTVFYNEYNELRSQEFAFPNLVVDNNLEGETYGAELSLDWRVTTNWDLVASYSFLKTDLRAVNGSTDFVELAHEGSNPENQFSIRSHLNLGNNIELDKVLYYVDELPSASTTVSVDDYWRFDARLAWKPNDNIELSIVGQDIFGNGRLEYAPALYQNTAEIERSVYAQVKFKF